MTREKFRFSFVMPVYNVEDYLEEAIESIVNQTMSFEEYVQLILVNDGSPDNSGAICERYAEKYPDNVVYIKQENAGVSAARNAGLTKVKGRYVGFLDSDDTLSRGTLDEVFLFFESNYDDIDIASIPIELFGAEKGPHPLNDRFSEGSRVIRLDEGYTYAPQSNVSSAFFKRSAVDGMLFDESLAYGEDGKFANQLITKRMTLGVVSGVSQYNYRKRTDGSSAVDTMKYKLSWYFDILEKSLIPLAEDVIHEYGSVPTYVQYVILHDLRWRFVNSFGYHLNEHGDIEKYKKLLIKALSYVDDKTILNFSPIATEYKFFMISLKRGVPIEKLVSLKDNGDIFLGKSLAYRSSQRVKVTLNFIDIRDGRLELDGNLGGFSFGGRELFFMVNGDYVKASTFIQKGRRDISTQSLREVIYQQESFKISLPIDPSGTAIGAFFKVNGRYHRVNFYFSHFSGLVKSIGAKYTFSIRDNYIISSNSLDSLYVEQYSKASLLKKELRLFSDILNTSGLLNACSSIFDGVLSSVFSSRYRAAWVFMDRVDRAGDNAEYAFKYSIDRSRNAFFIVDRESKDYGRLKDQFGRRVVKYGSYMHRILYITANLMVSSHFDDNIINPFGYNPDDRIVNRKRFRFIYLQHGVIAADLSSLINKYKKNISLICVASDAEYKHIIEGDYFYTKDDVSIAGQPRFDGMRDERDRIVMLAPSWRFNIAGKAKKNKRGVVIGRYYSSVFRKSDYYKFYNNLLSDERVLQELKKNNYKIKFYLHPQFTEQYRDFSHLKNEVVEIVRPPYNYNDEMSRANLLVTDYSGIAFDFAYMKRPIIYSQFDHDQFYEHHTYTRGSFSFKDDGFGPVVLDYDAAVESILRMLEDGCRVDSKYLKRTEKFYYRIDKDNSRRVYESIDSYVKEESTA